MHDESRCTESLSHFSPRMTSTQCAHPPIHLHAPHTQAQATMLAEVCKRLGRDIWEWGAEVSWEDILWTAQGSRETMPIKWRLIPFSPSSPFNKDCLKAGGLISYIWGHPLLRLLKVGSEM